ncbi:MAG: hypothetical protein JST16_09900 [Bdellovibrionales bacterium]|nr:hypothetical protein [Bdellovibrionales bacterium]
MADLYRDKSILISDEAITIEGYYFPSGKARVIKWDQIQAVFAETLTFMGGKYRMWGMGLKPYWFNKDWRAEKDNMLIIDTGNFIRAAITPDNFAAAKAALETKLTVQDNRRR